MAVSVFKWDTNAYINDFILNVSQTSQSVELSCNGWCEILQREIWNNTSGKYANVAAYVVLSIWLTILFNGIDLLAIQCIFVFIMRQGLFFHISNASFSSRLDMVNICIVKCH